MIINFTTTSSDTSSYKQEINIRDSILISRINSLKDSLNILYFYTILPDTIDLTYVTGNEKLQGITKNIVHLADSAKNEDGSNK